MRRQTTGSKGKGEEADRALSVLGRLAGLEENRAGLWREEGKMEATGLGLQFGLSVQGGGGSKYLIFLFPRLA